LDGVKVAQPCNRTDRIKTYFIIIFFSINICGFDKMDYLCRNK
jgi:hypothetical protein